jgi:RecA-family ATPase
MSDDEWKDRFIRMEHHLQIQRSHLDMVCTKGDPTFKFNTASGRAHLRQIAAAHLERPPKVLFIDSVYMAFHGSLTKDDVVNAFLTEVDALASTWQAAVVLVHHTKKPTYDQHGSAFETTDNDVYGSQFLLGAVDHVVRLEPVKNETDPHKRAYDRWITCDTQRTGGIVSDIRIRLEQPDPLYFHPVDHYEAEQRQLLELLQRQKEPQDLQQIIQLTRSLNGRAYSKGKTHKVLSHLVEQGKLTKEKMAGSNRKVYDVVRHKESH